MGRKRLRNYDVKVGKFPTGRRNLITDVPGVKVGNFTLIKENPVFRTGVTVVFPADDCIYNLRIFASSFVMNGYGKSTGLIQIEELGLLETPIFITSTLNVGKVWDAAVEYILSKVKDAKSINPVVMECNDLKVSQSELRPVGKDEVFKAIENASVEFELGNVGAGTGMVTFGFKGGLGSSSRVVGEYTVGALVVSNFGRKEDFSGYADENTEETGSIIVVVATNAPLIPNQLKRIAKRGAIGIMKAGGRATHGSGDIILAFSNAVKIPRKTNQLNVKYIPDDSKIFQDLMDATIETVEEAIYDALLCAEDMRGRDGRIWKAIEPEIIIKKLEQN
ncbi:MAG: P1 family peptidase [Thermotogaceae bacterium]|nr:P1 family peptidase [Thermotogaceae bacterium]